MKFPFVRRSTYDKEVDRLKQALMVRDDTIINLTNSLSTERTKRVKAENQAAKDRDLAATAFAWKLDIPAPQLVVHETAVHFDRLQTSYIGVGNDFTVMVKESHLNFQINPRDVRHCAKYLPFVRESIAKKLALFVSEYVEKEVTTLLEGIK